MTNSDIPPTNTTLDGRLLLIRNAWHLGLAPSDMCFKFGFAQLPLEDCPLTPEEYRNEEKVKEILYPKYKSAVRFLFPDATRVEILEHAVRKRHPRWLSGNLERHHLDTNQPSDYVHIASRKFNNNPKGYSRFVVVNLWKPIRGPVYDFRLTLCDRRTIGFASQTTAMDIVHRNYINENTRVYFDEKHEWYHWHGLQANEVIAFVQTDSVAENTAGVSHTAFLDPRVGDDGKQLKESIEARVFVFFE
ncbi:hypothetical protein B0H66DRAFT_534359 [Apodospora peruviana]|uniref:Methyltransferase n=1 Tax=Apodospora peruviana TaxID=516989 RepID=A0AAE0M1S5_9PEZI|nr:hypothetical protein B0H66DRAFT_534359 [Apodospora peruviana]